VRVDFVRGIMVHTKFYRLRVDLLLQGLYTVMHTGLCVLFHFLLTNGVYKYAIEKIQRVIDQNK